MDHIIFLSLGSNLGNRSGNLRTAIDALTKKVQPMAESSIYETEPWGYSDQPKFLNMVLKGETELTPQDLLAYLKSTESSLGRKETFRFGPRLLDIDILFYDQLVMNTPSLIIPHPRIAERAFVLTPMAEISPDFIHPVLGISIAQLKTNVDNSSIKLYQPSAS